jgi:hypothetical protein
VKRKITINYIDITIGSVSSTHPAIRQQRGDKAASVDSILALALILMLALYIATASHRLAVFPALATSSLLCNVETATRSVSAS